jgi:hypothetical protein
VFEGHTLLQPNHQAAIELWNAQQAHPTSVAPPAERTAQ